MQSKAVAESLRKACLCRKHNLTFEDLVLLAKRCDLNLDSHNSRSELLRGIAVDVGGNDEAYVELVMAGKADKPTSIQIEDSDFDSAYEEMNPDDKAEFPEVKEAVAGGKVQRHQAAFEIRQTQAKARAKAKAGSRP